MAAAALNVERTNLSDAADVALAAAGDRGAFERLYRSNSSRVFSLCVRMCADRAVAEELTQDVFVRAWQKIVQFRGESSFSTWLHRLAVNVVLNARKDAGKRRSRFDSLEGGSEGNEKDRDWTGSKAPPLHAERMDLETAIAALPKGARRVFVLHDVEGYKHEEIAEMLGVTSGGSKAQLHRARLLLREALQR